MHPRAALPLLLLACAPTLRAQNVVLDEGTFRLSRAGQEIGTETFAIRRVGQGADAHIIANAMIELDLPTGHEQIKPLLRATNDLGVDRYQMEVSGREPTEVAVTLTGRRFVARTRTPSGEQEREYRAAPGAVVLDPDVAHQYWFLSRLAAGSEVPVLVPLEGSQGRVAVKSAAPEALELATGTVAARHVTFDSEGGPREVWYDAEGRVLKVAVPGTGFVAERTAR